MRTITILAAIAIVLIAVLLLLLLKIIGFRQAEVEVACGPELVQNGGFEDKDFPAVGVTALTDSSDPHATANCRPGGDRCLQNWAIGAESRRTPLAWVQNGTGIGGVPNDPNPNEKRFLDMSGGSNHPGVPPHDPFPPVGQTIHVDAGDYQLRFDLGQDGGPNAPPNFSGPVSLTVDISGVITRNLQVTSDANGSLWQTQTPVAKAPNSGDITLRFQASPDQTKPFIGLDNVSLRQLKPFSVCPSP